MKCVFISVLLVRPERFELPTFWFVARRSIQLSYGRNCGDSFQFIGLAGIPQLLRPSRQGVTPATANRAALSTVAAQF